MRALVFGVLALPGGPVPSTPLLGAFLLLLVTVAFMDPFSRKARAAWILTLIGSGAGFLLELEYLLEDPYSVVIASAWAICFGALLLPSSRAWVGFVGNPPRHPTE